MKLSWFSVRCVFAVSGEGDATQGQVYEERITLWLANSSEQAIEKAEAEAIIYANAIEDAPDRYLDIAQSFSLSTEPGDGVEIFSLHRRSTLSPSDYIDTFFDTGGEIQDAASG